MSTIVFIVGVISGSFLNVCIYRLPRRQSIIKPASHCPQCGKMLRWWDLIPIISWLWLKGRCRYCHKPISGQYLLIELLMGGVFVLLYSKLGETAELLRAGLLASFLIVIAAIDYNHQLIFDNILLVMAAAGVIVAILCPDLSVDYIDRCGGVLVGGGLLLLIILASRGGMGWGDLWFAAVLGLWLGWHYILLTLVMAFWGGAIFGIWLLLLKKKNRHDYIPFGPFLAAAALLGYLYGVDLIMWYEQWLL